MKEIKSFVVSALIYLSGFTWLTLIISRYITGGGNDFSSFLEATGLNSFYLFSLILVLFGGSLLLIHTYPSILSFFKKHYGTGSQIQDQAVMSEKE